MSGLILLLKPRSAFQTKASKPLYAAFNRACTSLSPSMAAWAAGQTRDRHAVRRAGNVIQTGAVAEFDRIGVAAMFAADAEFDIFARFLAATFAGDFYQFAHAFLIQRRKRILFEHAGVVIIRQEAGGIVAAQPKRRLRQIVSAES